VDGSSAWSTDDPNGVLRAADGHQQRTGWGYQTLVREVSDSLHLRRFCLLPLTQRVPDESTVRKLVRRLGPETVAELTRVVIGTARRETRFVARAVRIDATVVEADIRYPTDGVLAWQGARALAREGRKLAGRLRGQTGRVVDRSRQLGKTVRAISRTLARRTGQRRDEVMELVPANPFVTVDQPGVGRLMRIACEEGRATRSDLKLGICGEHGGDPDSVRFCHTLGLDYVSCSPFRVPTARLAAGQAALGEATTASK
jgi:hypothetical protein